MTPSYQMNRQIKKTMDTKPDEKAPRMPDTDSSPLVLNAVRGIMVLVVPLAGVVGAYYSTRASLEGDIRELRQDISYSRESTKGELERIRSDLVNLHKQFDRHDSMGIGGIPHPTGVVVEIERISDRLKRLENKVMP